MYHVFLVWMGKSIPRASLVTAYVALRPRDGVSHPYQELMRETYSLICKKVRYVRKNTPLIIKQTTDNYCIINK